jgi:hypothetical protein
MGQEKSLRVQPEVSHDRTQPLGIDLRVVGVCCDTLMAQERLHVAHAGFAFVDQERGSMTQGCAEITGARPLWQASLIRALNALLLKKRALPTKKDERRSREVDPHSAAVARL